MYLLGDASTFGPDIEDHKGHYVSKKQWKSLNEDLCAIRAAAKSAELHLLEIRWPEPVSPETLNARILELGG